jgi:hypothetical protein
MMDDKYYPRNVFDQDLEVVKKMDIPDDLKREKGLALANIYLNQNDEQIIDHLTIADHRENILGKSIT